MEFPSIAHSDGSDASDGDDEEVFLPSQQQPHQLSREDFERAVAAELATGTVPSALPVGSGDHIQTTSQPRWAAHEACPDQAPGTPQQQQARSSQQQEGASAASNAAAESDLAAAGSAQAPPSRSWAAQPSGVVLLSQQGLLPDADLDELLQRLSAQQKDQERVPTYSAISGQNNSSSNSSSSSSSGITSAAQRDEEEARLCLRGSSGSGSGVQTGQETAAGVHQPRWARQQQQQQQQEAWCGSTPAADAGGKLMRVWTGIPVATVDLRPGAASSTAGSGSSQPPPSSAAGSGGTSRAEWGMGVGLAGGNGSSEHLDDSDDSSEEWQAFRQQQRRGNPVVLLLG